MAFYRLFPIQDATLYSEYPTQNTGLDEILEASLKVSYVDAPQASRFLIQFSTDEINDVLNNSYWDSIFIYVNKICHNCFINLIRLLFLFEHLVSYLYLCSKLDNSIHH